MKKHIFNFLLFFLISIFTFAAEYSIESLDIQAKINKDASMDVQETVKYQIGEINGILFDIDAKGFGGISSIEIFEDNGTDNSGNLIFERVDPARYEITVDDELYKIKLYSKNYDNTRTFRFVYTLPDAVTVYDDVAQFNRKMVGENWQNSIDNISIDIKVPVPANYDENKILAFGHGPLTGNIQKNADTISYSLKDFYPGEFIETHILMEPEIFSQIDKNKIIHKSMKEELLAMEKKLADEADAERERAIQRANFYSGLRNKIIGFYAVIISLWGAIVYYLGFARKRKNKYTKDYPQYLREVPDKYSPALAGTIVTEKPDGQEILATLLDLIRRKYISLDSFENKNTLTLIKDSVDLSEQEKLILNIYFDDYGNGKSVVLEDIRPNSVPRSIANKFEKWKSSIFTEMANRNLKMNGLGCLFGGLIGLLGLIIFITSPLITFFSLEIFSISYEDVSLFVPLIFFGQAGMGLSLLILARSSKEKNDDYQKAYARWSAFKNFIADYSLLEEAKISSIHLWEEYFVYAVALGVSDKVVKAYKKALDMGYIENLANANMTSTMRTINLMNLYSNTRLYNSLASATTQTYSNSMRDIANSRKSSRGFGGGFSSGSSHGGGSRGGGGAF